VGGCGCRTCCGFNGMSCDIFLKSSSGSGIFSNSPLPRRSSIVTSVRVPSSAPRKRLLMHVGDKDGTKDIRLLRVALLENE